MKNEPHKRYLVYASYEVDGQEHLVDWQIFAPFTTTAMNTAMRLIGELGGDHRHIDEVIEMTPEFIERVRKMNSHREGELHGHQRSRGGYYRHTEDYSRLLAGHLELQN